VVVHRLEIRWVIDNGSASGETRNRREKKGRKGKFLSLRSALSLTKEREAEVGKEGKGGKKRKLKGTALAEGVKEGRNRKIVTQKGLVTDKERG